MRVRSKRWILVAALIVLFVVAIFVFGKRKAATADAVRVTFVGFTNAPNDPNQLFAMFCVSNCAGYSIRWWGGWTEIEGSTDQHAEIVNFSLPRFGSGTDFSPVFRAGESFKFAVGYPLQGFGPGRWRFDMEFSRYSLQQRWMDASIRHRWIPRKLGSIVLVDTRRAIDPPNHVIARSEWLK